MELKELKKTWERLDSGRELDEDQIRGMLVRRTGNLLDRIDRNIKIGFVVLFLLIIVFALDDFFFSPLLVENVNGADNVPRWLLFLGVFSNALVVCTFIYFVVKYYFVKRSCDVNCDLKETLVKIIDTLTIYRRLFYLALVALLFAVSSGLITGLYNGIAASAEQQGVLFSDIPPNSMLTVILIGLAVLLITVGGIFLILRWGFNKLYGNYISKLKSTLRELHEIDE